MPTLHFSLTPDNCSQQRPVPVILPAAGLGVRWRAIRTSARRLFPVPALSNQLPPQIFP